MLVIYRSLPKYLTGRIKQFLSLSKSKKENKTYNIFIASTDLPPKIELLKFVV